MTKEQKQDFTRRITQANRSELVLIKFEMLFVYMDNICEYFQKEDKHELTNHVRYADAVLKSFQETLDFQYEIAGQLYALYDFHRRQLAKVLVRHSLKELEQSRKLLQQLYEAFVRSAKQDKSGPLMKNAQQVYAGYTYGKNNINESYDIQSSRGFFA
ncbi:hypothetical protein C823_005665 [Eubacterium plexicaudatum ASF492]|uniref:Flagellar protein FliS n=1 Tax=Eubacterium plexicaudatum ASF492 TaxID=1235802 RepID=N2AY41_9FIRM|nr:hypothetical protein C823_005665 [Eubacterium plexicaudatum ASF492]